MTGKGDTLGLIWEDDIVENEFGWGVHLLTPKLRCLPQTWTPAGKLYIYAGPGDWRTLRRHAQRLSGTDGEPEPIPPHARKVHEVRLEPKPLVTVDDRVQATLVVENLRSRSLEGKVELTPAGAAACRTCVLSGHRSDGRCPLGKKRICCLAARPDGLRGPRCA